MVEFEILITLLDTEHARSLAIAFYNKVYSKPTRILQSIMAGKLIDWGYNDSALLTILNGL